MGCIKNRNDYTELMRILIIEDNEKLAQTIKRGLEQKKFVADYVTDGMEGYRRISALNKSYDGIILDVMLPTKDGFSISHDLRAQGITTPILMLTARDTLADKISGFDGGADDYLVKPFAFEELIARLQAILRRPKNLVTQEIAVGGIRLNQTTREVQKDNQPIALSHKEFIILEYFMMNPDRVITRQEILDHAWEYEFNPFSNLVDVKIKNIRKKIDPKATLIETVRGAGYRFNT